MSGGVAGVPINACVAEFVGTFLLIFTVGCNVLSGNATWGAVSIACVLMVSIYAFGAVSGGHFNPAVSVALQLAHKLGDQGWTQVVVYCVAQICGGVCAAFSYTALFNKHFSLAPKAELWAGALLVEGIYTFLLCLVVLNAAASKAKAGKNQYFGLAIGFVIIAGGYGAGALGAGCFNPAVAISITAASEDKNVKTCFAFIVVELIGAAMAVVITALVRPEEARDGALPPQEGYSLQSKLLSEVVGTYILVLTVGLNVLGGSPAVAFSIAASLTCMIYTFGDVSGAHFNPAVTVAINLCGKEKADWAEASKYALAQITGGILAAFTYAFAHGFKTFPLGAGAGHGWGSIAAAETVFTFVLTFVVLCVAVVEDQPAPEFIGLIIGATVTAGGFAVGTVSGGCLNPAVSIGIAAAHMLNGGFVIKAFFYTACQLAGAVVAAMVFKKLYMSTQPLITTYAKDWSKICIAEFVGTFLLVFTVGCNVLTENAVWGAVSIACVLMVSIYAVGGASGGHLNPAVTASLALAGKLNSGDTPLGKQVCMYWLSQISGGLSAAVSYHMLFDKGFALAAKPGHNVGAHVCEVIYTFMLCFVVLNAAASKAKAGKNQYFGLAIGFVIIAGGYAAGPLGAGCFNPAVALAIYSGSDFTSEDNEIEAGKRCLFYIVAELAGAALAASLLSIVRPEEKNQNQPPREGYGLTSKLISEVIGTYMLVFTVGLNVLGGSPAAAFSIAASLTCMIYAIGDVSGGHFNPAVTLAIHMCGKDKPDFAEAGQYMLAQVLGGICAAFTYSICHNGETFPLGPGTGFDLTKALIAEAAFTFVLAAVVLCVAVVADQPAPEFIGLIIGSCVTVGGFAVGGISGGALNPAVAIAIAAVHSVQRGIGGALATTALGYTAAELGGGAAAAALFSMFYGVAKQPQSPPGSPLQSPNQPISA